MPKTTQQTAFTELDGFIDALPDKDGALIAVLHKAQELYGCLPVELQNHVARRLQIPAAKVFGVVTFYSYFNIKPKGKYRISVCMGTACFVRGADIILEEFKKQLGIAVGETTQDRMFSLDAIRCVGACGLAPVVSVNGKVYGRVKAEQVQEIMEEYLAMGGGGGE